MKTKIAVFGTRNDKQRPIISFLYYQTSLALPSMAKQLPRLRLWGCSMLTLMYFTGCSRKKFTRPLFFLCRENTCEAVPRLCRGCIPSFEAAGTQKPRNQRLNIYVKIYAPHVIGAQFSTNLKVYDLWVQQICAPLLRSFYACEASIRILVKFGVPLLCIFYSRTKN